MQISFGRKIPIMNSKVYDKKAGKLVNATVYELDGKDKEDYNYVLYHGDNVPFKTEISFDLYSKCKKYQNGEITPNSLDNFKKFYALETKNGEISALIEALKVKDFADIIWMGADQDGKYGLLGQTIMASVMRQMLLEKDPTLIVSDPSTKGREFYTNTCGFKKDDENPHKVVINKEGMFDFLKSYSEKTEE